MLYDKKMSSLADKIAEEAEKEEKKTVVNKTKKRISRTSVNKNRKKKYEK